MMPNNKTPITDHIGMSDKALIDFCRKRASNWKKIPKDRLNDTLISAVIDAHQKGIEIIYSIKTPRRSLHIEEALFKWKSKALKRLLVNDIPRNEEFICALISEDPDCFKGLPRDLQTQAVIDAAILADYRMFSDAPNELITEHHILIVLERNHEFLQACFKTPICQLSMETKEHLLEKTPTFLVNSALFTQLDSAQVERLASATQAFWNFRRLLPVESVRLVKKMLEIHNPGPGASLIRRLVKYAARNNYAVAIQDVLNSDSLHSDIGLVSLLTSQPKVFAEHAKEHPRLMPYYQQLYGAESAMKLTESPDIRREILSRDLGM
jgi:hypothetical protein